MALGLTGTDPPLWMLRLPGVITPLPPAKFAVSVVPDPPAVMLGELAMKVLIDAP